MSNHHISFEEPLTRGHKKKARTKQLLIDTALSIYADIGVNALTLQDLAEKANVSNGTIYNYFKTRDDVLEAVGMTLANDFSDAVTQASANIHSGIQRVAIGIRMFINKAIQDKDWAKALINVIHLDDRMRSTVANNIVNDLELAKKEGSIHFKDRHIAVTFIMSATIGALISITEGHVIEDHDVILTEMILTGLGAEPQQAYAIAQLPLPL